MGSPEFLASVWLCKHLRGIQPLSAGSKNPRLFDPSQGACAEMTGGSAGGADNEEPGGLVNILAVGLVHPLPARTTLTHPMKLGVIFLAKPRRTAWKLPTAAAA